MLWFSPIHAGFQLPGARAVMRHCSYHPATSIECAYPIRATHWLPSRCKLTLISAAHSALQCPSRRPEPHITVQLQGRPTPKPQISAAHSALQCPSRRPEPHITVQLQGRPTTKSQISAAHSALQCPSRRPEPHITVQLQGRPTPKPQTPILNSTPEKQGKMITALPQDSPVPAGRGRGSRGLHLPRGRLQS